MVIYESAKQPSNFHALTRVAFELAEHLFPQGKVIDSKTGSDLCRFFLMDRDRVTGLELHVHPLQENDFDRILSLVDQLEENGKEQGESLLKEIEGSRSFPTPHPEGRRPEGSREILPLRSAQGQDEPSGHLKKLPDGSLKEITLCLVAPSFSDALLERIRSSAFNIRLFQWSWLRSGRCEALWLQEVAHSGHDIQTDLSCPASDQVPRRELSTPELIAMARFGIELRNRRAEISWESLKYGDTKLNSALAHELSIVSP